MSEQAPIDLTHGDVGDLEALVDRESLGQVCRSFFELFGLSIRVLSARGALLADVHEQRSICRYVNGLVGGRLGCAAVVGQAQRLVPEAGPQLHGCFTGAVYQIVPIEYQGRQLGRFVVGPYLPAELEEVPQSLLDIDPGVDADKARQALDEMPRVREDTAARIAAHLSSILDLLLFVGHRAQLTSQMHLASVRESYRELARNNADLQQAYARLQELDRLKSNFLATISHELRTPLTSIIGYAEMLGSGLAGPLNDEQQGFSHTIQRKGEELLQLITSLLDLNKLDRSELKLDRQPLEVNALLEDIQDTVRPEARRKGITLTLEIPRGDLPQVLADTVRLKQVMLNLVSNALKFTDAGGRVILGAKRATFSPTDDDADGVGLSVLMAPTSALALYVRDTGSGIAEEELPKIFQAFYQVDGGATREHGGSGLGLAIVQRLVEAHGGRVVVDSRTGEGTTFSVLLPEAEPA